MLLVCVGQIVSRVAFADAEIDGEVAMLMATMRADGERLIKSVDAYQVDPDQASVDVLDEAANSLSEDRNTLGSRVLDLPLSTERRERLTRLVAAAADLEVSARSVVGHAGGRTYTTSSAAWGRAHDRWQAIRDAHGDVGNALKNVREHRRATVAKTLICVDIATVVLYFVVAFSVMRPAAKRLGQSWEAVKESEERYRVLFEEAADPVFVVADGVLVDCNARATEVLGYSREELIGRHPSMISPEFQPSGESSRELGDKLAYAALAGERQTCQWVHISKAGDSKVTELTFCRVRAGGMWQVLVSSHDLSAEVQREKERARHEAFLNTLLSAIPAPIFYKDADGRYIGCNSAFSRFTGKSEEELKGLTACDLYNSESAAELHEASKRLAAKGGMTQSTERWASATGRMHSFNVHRAAFLDPIGGVRGIIGCLTDVTDFEEAIRNLRMGEARYRTVVENLHDMLVQLDTDARLTFVNRTWSESTGFSERDSIGRPFSDFVYPPDRAVAKSWSKGLLSGSKERMDKPIRIWSTDGGYRWVELNSRPIMDGEQQVVGLTCNLLDITERKAAEDALRESEDRLRLLYESAPMGLVLCNLDGTVVQANRAFADMCGYTAKSLAGMTLDRLAPTEAMDHVERIRDELERTGRYGPLELEVARKDGQRLFIVMHGALVHNSDGRPRIWSYAEDVTARRNQETLIEEQFLALGEAQVQLELRSAALEAANERLSLLATMDALTGIANHRGFQEGLTNAFTASLLSGAPLSLVMLDVDKFKSYNDAYGHPAGDDVLHDFAQILASSAQFEWIVARYGGEEFMVIMPGVDEAGARAAAETMRAAVAGYHWRLRKITASFGIATRDASTTQAADLIAAADEALYASKDGGRNRVTHTYDLRRKKAA